MRHMFGRRSRVPCSIINIYSLVHTEPRSKEVSFNTQEIYCFVRYYRKEIFVTGRGPVGLRISKRKNTEPLKDEVLCESARKITLAYVDISLTYQIPVHPSNSVFFIFLRKKFLLPKKIYLLFLIFMTSQYSYYRSFSFMLM